jgi:hypothetical protein
VLNIVWTCCARTKRPTNISIYQFLFATLSNASFLDPVTLTFIVFVNLVGPFRRISVSELVAVDLPHFHKGKRQYKKIKQSVLQCIAYVLCLFLSAFKCGPSTSTRQMSAARFVVHFPCPVLSLPLYTTTVLSRVRGAIYPGEGGV